MPRYRIIHQRQKKLIESKSRVTERLVDRVIAIKTETFLLTANPQLLKEHIDSRIYVTGTASLRFILNTKFHYVPSTDRITQILQDLRRNICVIMIKFQVQSSKIEEKTVVSYELRV